jgi:rhodanese-related sulfurtransferase
MNSITAEELANRLKEGERTQVIDVRDPSEFAAGHIPGAVNIPLGEVESRLEDMTDVDEIVLVCQTGTRAGMACERIEDRKKRLLVLEDGTSSWISGDRSIVASTQSRWSLDRQVRLGAGMMVLAGTLLSLFAVPGWIYLAVFVGAGLTFAGATDICMMGTLLSKAPWNKPVKHSECLGNEAQKA